MNTNHSFSMIFFGVISAFHLEYFGASILAMTAITPNGYGRTYVIGWICSIILIFAFFRLNKRYQVFSGYHLFTFSFVSTIIASLLSFILYFSLILPFYFENKNIPEVLEEYNFNRDDIVKYLEENNIQTRLLFAGNLVKHPCFNMMRKNKEGYRVIGDLADTDYIMKNSFWVGVYPGMTKNMLQTIINMIHKFIYKRNKEAHR